MYLAVERKWIVSLGHVSHLLLMVWENSTCRLDNPNINAIRMEENKGNSICALFLNFRIILNENSYDANVSIWQNYRDYIDIFDESIHLMSNYLSNVESLKSREWNLNSPIWTQLLEIEQFVSFIKCSMFKFSWATRMEWRISVICPCPPKEFMGDGHLATHSKLIIFRRNNCYFVSNVVDSNRH